MNEGRIEFVSFPRNVAVARSVLRDARLSFGARGLFVFLADLPEGWIIRLNHLAKISPSGKDAIRSLLRELEVVKAIKLVRDRILNGKFNGWRWLIYGPDKWAQEAPLTPRVKAENGKPDSGETAIGQFENGNSEAKDLPSITVASSAETARKFEIVEPGIWIWTEDDRRVANGLIEKMEPEKLLAAIAAARKNGDPLPKRIEREARKSEFAARNHSPLSSLPPLPQISSEKKRENHAAICKILNQQRSQAPSQKGYLNCEDSKLAGN